MSCGRVRRATRQGRLQPWRRPWPALPPDASARDMSADGRASGAAPCVRTGGLVLLNRRFEGRRGRRAALPPVPRPEVVGEGSGGPARHSISGKRQVSALFRVAPPGDCPSSRDGHEAVARATLPRPRRAAPPAQVAPSSAGAAQRESSRHTARPTPTTMIAEFSCYIVGCRFSSGFY